MRYIALLALLGYCYTPLFSNPIEIQSIKESVKLDVATSYYIIFDNSGSMEGRRLTQAKEAFSGWLSTVQEGNNWSLYCFNNRSPKRLINTQRNGQLTVVSAINKLQADSSTPLADTIRSATKDILQRKTEKPYETLILLVFTDGEENINPGGNAAVTSAIRILRKKGIEVIAIGYAGDGGYMQGSASRYYRADDGRALAQGLALVEAEIDPTAPVVISEQDYKNMEGK